MGGLHRQEYEESNDFVNNQSPYPLILGLEILDQDVTKRQNLKWVKYQSIPLSSHLLDHCGHMLNPLTSNYQSILHWNLDVCVKSVLLTQIQINLTGFLVWFAGSIADFRQ